MGDELTVLIFPTLEISGDNIKLTFVVSSPVDTSRLSISGGEEGIYSSIIANGNLYTVLFTPNIRNTDTTMSVLYDSNTLQSTKFNTGLVGALTRADKAFITLQSTLEDHNIKFASTISGDIVENKTILGKNELIDLSGVSLDNCTIINAILYEGDLTRITSCALIGCSLNTN